MTCSGFSAFAVRRLRAALRRDFVARLSAETIDDVLAEGLFVIEFFGLAGDREAYRLLDAAVRNRLQIATGDRRSHARTDAHRSFTVERSLLLETGAGPAFADDGSVVGERPTARRTLDRDRAAS